MFSEHIVFPDSLYSKIKCCEFLCSFLVTCLWLWPIILVLLTILRTLACLWRAACRMSDDTTASIFWKETSSTPFFDKHIVQWQHTLHVCLYEVSSVCLSVIAFVSKPLYFQPPKKVMQPFFLGCTGPHFGPTSTNHTKNYQKITFGVLFSLPPQNALQCTTVQCNVL